MLYWALVFLIVAIVAGLFGLRSCRLCSRGRCQDSILHFSDLVPCELGEAYVESSMTRLSTPALPGIHTRFWCDPDVISRTRRFR